MEVFSRREGRNNHGDTEDTERIEDAGWREQRTKFSPASCILNPPSFFFFSVFSVPPW
jgi:hypothetical protein